jgi:predicted dienelactone hydrolase
LLSRSTISRLRRSAPGLALLLGFGCGGALPAGAVELVGLRLPLLGEVITARVSELGSSEALWNGNSDLAELNRATEGRFADALSQVVHQPLPFQDLHGSAMAQQVSVLLSQLLEVEPDSGASTQGAPVAVALARLKSAGQPLTLFNLLVEIPARKVIIRLDLAEARLQALQSSQERIDRAVALLPTLPAAPASALAPGPFPILTRVSTITLDSHPEPLEVTVVRPKGTPTLPPVVISHGLWDSPASFLGWARHLASHGAPVFLPRHPGSDIQQQAEMLAGRVPPPSPQEFLRRPGDVRAVLDALDAGSLSGGEGIRARRVVMIGHSWGGTTALQLAGARSLPASLWADCGRTGNPNRNISWVLQCSFLPAATTASLADPRIVRAVAVSPPQGLVFELGARDLQVPVLLVSGSRDVVVPTDPEALLPFGSYPRGSNRLVVVEGGNHFNLPAAADSDGGPLRALLLHWVRGKTLTPTSHLRDPRGMALHLVPTIASQP